MSALRQHVRVVTKVASIWEGPGSKLGAGYCDLSALLNFFKPVFEPYRQLSRGRSVLETCYLVMH